MQKNNLKHYFHLHFLVFIAGFTAILGEAISLSSIALVWHRMLIALVLTFLFLLYYRYNLKIDIKDFFKFSLAGIIIALHWITFFEAIEQSNISITLAMFSTGAFFASLIEPIFFKRKVRPVEIILGLIVICGVFIILQANIDSFFGVLLGIVSALLASLFSVLNGKLVQNNNPFVISFYEFLSGVVFILLYLIFSGNLIDLNIESFFSYDYLYVFILGSICTAYAFIASVHILKFLSPYTLVLTYNLEPVYGILLAIFIFPETEKMEFSFYIGTLIIISTIIINSTLKIMNNKKVSS
ncbi:DMT family transporter [Flavobacteriaceae bacterium]|jgi:drug/metabolite transporter (DMT)-like permease|nr:DMT family transporter [Flavobacteriaceae bacterium]MDA9067777.1 DMT family transporter [Flavobacteriaceae bacterium]MDB4212891.1 DMT family transporter [Flavobacteriaceae bacterium]MDC0552180.1 DMT family transporter [Flavobacteriaceae bacterium]|tara:strand:- start:240 stop:1133 length:894 start_codon:yes stop_codon:yes gene_type:complete